MADAISAVPNLPDPLDALDQLVERARSLLTTSEREALLDELVSQHEQFSDPHNEEALFRIEEGFLLGLRNEPEILADSVYRDFAARCIEQKTFYRIEWKTVEEVVQVAEVLYGFRFSDTLPADQLTSHVRDLIRHALRQFERQREPESMFELLQRAPIPAAMMDAELMRQRNWLHLYEMRRVSRKRRWLYGYLLLQILLILLIFPLLFQNFENGAIQGQVEQSTGLDIVDGTITCRATTEGAECDPTFQFLSFEDSLYWSVVTYSTIGYGDVRPVTDVGKLLSGLHGLMGVLTTGVIAGLVLNWISPRDLP